MKTLILIVSLLAISAGPSFRQDAAPGERLVNQSCLACHDMRRIQVQALDEAGWRAKVASMIEKGAVVREQDEPVLVAYLVDHHGPVPEGEGKPILLNTCTLCHDLKRIKEHGATRRQWGETLLAMLNEGAPLSDEELPIIWDYLSVNFPPLR